MICPQAASQYLSLHSTPAGKRNFDHGSPVQRYGPLHESVSYRSLRLGSVYVHKSHRHSGFITISVLSHGREAFSLYHDKGNLGVV